MTLIEAAPEGASPVESVIPTYVESDKAREIANTRALAHQFAQSPKFELWRLEGIERPAIYPHDFIRQASKLGLTAMNTPGELDGSAEIMHPLAKVAVIEEIARKDAGLALNLLVQNSLTAFPLARAIAIEKQSGLNTSAIDRKEEILRSMGQGYLLACFGLTEPRGGSDATNLVTNAEDKGDYWEINGEKTFITSAYNANFMILAARTGSPGKDGISTFLVDMNIPGITVSKPFDKIGQPSSQVCSVNFDHVRIRKDMLLGRLNEGWNEIIRPTLEHSRTWIAAQGTGFALHAYDLVKKYTQERLMHNKPIAEWSKAEKMLDIMANQINIARYLTYKAAIVESEKDPNLAFYASLAKYISGETAVIVTNNAVLLHGGYGYIDEPTNEIAQVYKEAPVIRIYEGPAQVQTSIIDSFLARINQNIYAVDPLVPLLASDTTPPENIFSFEQATQLVEEWEQKLNELKSSPSKV